MQENIKDWLRAFRPAKVGVNWRERWRAIGGAMFGLAVAGALSRWLAGPVHDAIWLVAPMGASAMLLFGMPASPLAQPWAVVGGNVLSAVVGVACARWIGQPVAAAALAVGMAIAMMFSLRCLHPPGGAMALLAVLSHSTHYELVLPAVLVDSLILVTAAIVYNTATGRRYPHPQLRAPSQPVQTAASRFSPADLDAALAHYNQVLDVSRDDLETLLRETEMAAYRRNLGEIRCADIMSREPIRVEFGTPLDEAWALMRRHRIKALPVVDRAQRIVGIITLADFMRHADVDAPQGIGPRLRDLVRRTASVHSEKPEVAGQIMTRQVRVSSADRHVVDLVPLFSEGGHHHIPIVGAESRLVGIITQTDLVRALYRAVQGGVDEKK
jgi:CBS domain-containing membrane protein